MNTVPFIKIHGTGNDFILLENKWIEGFSAEQRARWIKEISHRNFGIGSDGVIVYNKIDDAIWDWIFFNPDGSEANFCGNAARATCNYFLKDLGLKQISLKTRDNLIEGKMADGLPEISYHLKTPELKKIVFNQPIIQGQLIDTGVPHFVIKTDNIEQNHGKDSQWLSLMKSQEFLPGGANITFLQVEDNSNIKTQTFERGVNGFTLSCGSGVVAASLAALNLKSGTVNVSTPGGKLKVKYEDISKKVFLSGEAKIVFAGEWRNV